MPLSSMLAAVFPGITQETTMEHVHQSNTNPNSGDLGGDKGESPQHGKPFHKANYGDAIPDQTRDEMDRGLNSNDGGMKGGGY